MTITYYPELALFSQDIDEERGVLTVTYHPPPSSLPPQSLPEQQKLEVPLEPNVCDLELLEVDLHRSPTQGYRMPDSYGGWFGKMLGWGVCLVYLGPGRRKVLGSLAPGSNSATPTQSWIGSVAQGLSLGNWGRREADKGEDEGITFADIAAYLVITEESLREVSARLPEGVEMDRTKFRANVVVEGAGSAWEEDFWGGVRVGGGRGGEIVLTGNCARCVSLNVDYETGRAGMGEEGMVLKKLMRDRRVDSGTKWSPVFGRYGFLKGEVGEVRVGDEVAVSRWNEERTVFGKSVRCE